MSACFWPRFLSMFQKNLFIFRHLPKQVSFMRAHPRNLSKMPDLVVARPCRFSSNRAGFRQRSVGERSIRSNWNLTSVERDSSLWRFSLATIPGRKGFSHFEQMRLQISRIRAGIVTNRTGIPYFVLSYLTFSPWDHAWELGSQICCDYQSQRLNWGNSLYNDLRIPDVIILLMRLCLIPMN